MKKLFLMIAALIIAAGASFAQDFTVGARVGMNVANISGDYKNLDAKIGLKFGVIGCFPLADNIYLEPGVFYSPKGAKNSEPVVEPTTNTKVNSDFTIKLNYLEIPLNAVYKYEINNNLAVRGHVGPYFAFGMFGRIKQEYNGELSYTVKDETLGFEYTYDGEKSKAFSNKADEGNLKRFDAGLNFGAGMEFSICYLGIQYALGLSNINSKNDKNFKMRNGVFSVDFGINF